MRKIFLIVVLMLGWVMEAKSQEGLQIAELFNGQYKRKDNAIEVVVKGNQLERYKLEVFRSLTIKNDPKDFERIEKLVEQDEKHAISKPKAKTKNFFIISLSFYFLNISFNSSMVTLPSI